MRKRSFVLLVTGAVVSIIACACSGPSTTPLRETLISGSGSVVVLGTDTPACDIVSFQVTVTGATLTSQGGTSGAFSSPPVSLISSTTPVRVDFASLMDFQRVLALSDVPTGTYSQATITLSDPQLVYFDFASSPPAPVSIAPTLTTLTLTANIDPPLDVTNEGTIALELDFDLLNSIEVDENGQLTGSIDPVFQLRPRIASSTDGFAVLEGLHGLVDSVSAVAANGDFTGTFALETLGGRGPTMTVHVTDSTVLNGVSDLNSLFPATFVDVEGFVDSSGNIVAREVNVQGLTDVGQGLAGFVGVVTSVTRDAPPNANEFTLFVRETYPDVSLSVPPTTNHVVRISPTTVFRVVSTQANPSQLTFDASTLGAGQEVAVYGNFLAATPTTPAVINASNVYLRLQTAVGNFATLEVAGIDGKTGGFSFTPGATIFGGGNFLALTFAETEFVDVADLNALTTAPTLAVKGLLLFEQDPGKAGTVEWTEPTLVFVAKRVRQLE